MGKRADDEWATLASVGDAPPDIPGAPIQDADWGDIGRSARTGARNAWVHFITLPEQVRALASQLGLEGAGALGELGQRYLPENWSRALTLDKLPGAIETMRGLSEPHAYPRIQDYLKGDSNQFGERTQRAVWDRSLGPMHEPQTAGGRYAKDKSELFTGMALAGPAVLGHIAMRNKPDFPHGRQKERDFESMSGWVGPLAKRDFNSHAAAVKNGEETIARLAAKGDSEGATEARRVLDFLKNHVKPWGP